MIWLVWRRQRAAILFAGALLAAYAVFVLVLGLSGAASARPDGPPLGVIEARLILLVLPGVIGVILGSGLFGRELERGTHVFALTQNVGRLLWWATGLLVVGVPAAVAVAAVTWLADGLLGAAERFFPLDTPFFDASGLLPVAHLLLAFAVASTAGLVARNALVAVAVGLGVVLVVQVVLPTTARFGYLAPLTYRGDVASIASAPQLEDARTLLVGEFGPDGRRASPPVPPCPPRTDPATCLRNSGVAEVEYVYQPHSRYWPFQGIEAGILGGLAVLAAGIGWWGLRRRVW